VDMKKATNLNLSSWLVRDNFEFVKMWCTWWNHRYDIILWRM